MDMTDVDKMRNLIIERNHWLFEEGVDKQTAYFALCQLGEMMMWAADDETEFEEEGPGQPHPYDE